MKHQKIYITFFLFLAISSCLSIFGMENHISLLEDSSPDTVEFAWDINEVLVTPNIVKMLETGVG